MGAAPGTLAAAGDRDTSFAGDGVRLWDSGNGYDRGHAVAVQPDGRVLVAGSADNGTDNDFALARFTADGSLDTGFGATGVVTWDSGNGYDYGRSVAVQPDGRVLVAGVAYNGTHTDLALARFTADGSLDTGFGAGDGDGTDGVALWDSGNGYDYGYSVAIQPDGRVLVAGVASNGTDNDLALARFTADGGLDTGFGAGDGDGTDGVALWDGGNGYDGGYSVAVQPDGRVLVAGSANNGTDTDLALARFTADGSLDTGFSAGDGDGTDGVALWDGGNGYDYGYSVAVQPDGRVLVAGVAHNGTDNDLALARFTADGNLDTGLGGVGVVTWDGGNGSDFGFSVAVQADGRVLVAGYADNGTDYDLVLARFERGALDDSFAWGTPAWDVVPDAFSLTDKVGLEPGTRVVSEEVPLYGLGTGVHVPVRTTTGGLTVLDDTGAQIHSDVPFARAFTNYRFSVHHTVADSGGTSVTSTVTAGGVRPTPRSLLALGPNQSADFTSTANQDPTFTGGTGSAEVAEDAATGTTVTTLTASDPEGQTLSYSITGGNSAGKFGLDATSGGLTVAGDLDHETASSYNLDVKVADPVDGEATATVAVNVTDVSEESGDGGGGGGGGGCTLAPTGRSDPLLGVLMLLAGLALWRRRGIGH